MMVEEIQNLNDKKNLLKKEINEIDKKIGEEKQKKKLNSSKSSNVLNRMGWDFNNELEDINRKRKELGLKPLSKPKATNLLIKHKGYKEKIKEDMINYKEDKNKNVK